MLHQQIRSKVRVDNPLRHSSVFNKSFGKKIKVVWFVYVNSRVGPSWPLLVEILEVKVIDEVGEVCPFWFRQYVCPLAKAIFYDVGFFPQGFELSWPWGFFCDIVTED